MNKFFSLSGWPSALLGVILALTASSAHAFLVTRNISGLWNLPDQERHGMTVTVTQTGDGGKSVITFLAVFDAAGQPSWLFSQGTVNGDTVSGPLFRVSGPGFLDPAGTPSAQDAIGDMSIVFGDCNNGMATFDAPGSSIGSGSFRIERISNLYRVNCTGGTVDDVRSTDTNGGAGTASEFEVFLTNTGVDADASGKAEFEERPDRTEFSVEVEDLPVGSYDLLIDEVVRAQIEVADTASGAAEGEVEFRSPVEPGKILLDFDPRGAFLDVVQGDTIYLSADLPTEGTPPGGGDDDDGDNDNDNDTEMTIEVELVNQGVISGANGDAEWEQRPDRTDFEVEIEDLPEGDYSLLVGGTERATITVVDTPSGPEGEVEFRDPPEAGKLPLDFDPRGEVIAVQQNGTDILAADFPLAGGNGGGSGDDDDDGDDDNGSGSGDDDDDGDDDNGGGSGDDDDDGDDDNGGGSGDDDDDDSDNDNNAGLNITVVFDNVGPDADASGEAEYEASAERVEFKVEAEDLDDGTYELVVGGSAVAMLVVTDDEGEVEFRDPSEAGKLPLDFDPLGQTVEIIQAGTVYLSLTMPAE